MIGKNFKITIPSNLVGTATKVKVYHSDYEPAALTVTILELDTDGHYVIKNQSQWDAFCTLVNSGVTFCGQTVKLTADITDAVTTMAGTNAYPFQGTFDGLGDELEFSSENEGDAGNAW